MSYLESNYSNLESPLSHKGRFGRLSYLAWTFIVSILYTCALMLVVAIGAIGLAISGVGFTPEGILSSSLGYLAIALLVIVVIIFMVLFINLTIRRLHDLNKSGWLVLLMLIPLVNIGFWIYVTCFKGTEGPNNFGPQRPTEQSEKYLGIIYAIFMVIFIFVYAASLVAFQKYMNLNNLQQLEQVENEFGLENDVADESLLDEEAIPVNTEVASEAVEMSDVDAIATSNATTQE